MMYPKSKTFRNWVSIFNGLAKTNCNSLAALVFAAFVLVFLWPGIIERASMQWDATEIYLPWKYFVTEQLKSGHWPLWNPYMSGGFAQQGDPGTWYEVSWMIGLFGTYNLQSLLFEYGFHLWIAAMGLYALLRGNGVGWLLSVTFGLAFAFNGFFIGNAQHIGWVVGLSWFPWMLLFLQKMIESALKKKNGWISSAIGLSLTAHFQFTGGYLGVTAVTIYLMTFWLAYLIFGRQMDMDFRKRIVLLMKLLATLVLFGLISAPAIASFVDLQSQITRSIGLSTADFQFGHWPVAAFWTQFFQNSSIDFAQRIGSDVSLINLHWGILPFVLVLFGLFQRKINGNQPAKFYSLLVLGVLMLLVSMGSDSFLHLPLVSKLPLLKLFRFPSLYRGFAMLFLLLASLIVAIRWLMSFPRLLYLISLLIVIDVFFYALNNRYNTVLVKIPAHEVNAVINKSVSESLLPTNTSLNLPKRLTVDTDSMCNATIPFMNQNQGIYLRMWAADGYNPYRISRLSDFGRDSMKIWVVMGDSQVHRWVGINDWINHAPSVFALDSKGEIIENGILGCDSSVYKGNELVLYGIRYNDELTVRTVKNVVVMQTPNQQWRARDGDGKNLVIGDYYHQGIVVAAKAELKLSFAPKYAPVSKILWMFGWLMILLGMMKFNGIGGWAGLGR